MRQHHKKRRINKTPLKIILIGIFLVLSYNYYNKNQMDIYFSILIELPFLGRFVESWIYWAIVLVICFGIWKLIDYIKIR